VDRYIMHAVVIAGSSYIYNQAQNNILD